MSQSGFSILIGLDIIISNTQILQNGSQKNEMEKSAKIKKVQPQPSSFQGENIGE